MWNLWTSGIEGRNEKQSAEEMLVIKIDGKFEHLKKPRRIHQNLLDIYMNMQ